MNSPAPAPVQSTTRAFTLLELLVVIGIIAVLLAALIPAVNSLTKTNATKSAVTLVMNSFEQARSRAVTSGSATYVVFADQTTPENYRCKAFIVFQDDKNFVQTAVTKWYFLPTGVAFQPLHGLLKAQSGDPRIAFPCPGNIGATPVELPFLKFDPNGMVADPATAADLFVKVFSGFVDSGGSPTFTDKNQENTLRLDQVAIARFTGRPRYIDPYAPQ